MFLCYNKLSFQRGVIMKKTFRILVFFVPCILVLFFIVSCFAKQDNNVQNEETANAGQEETVDFTTLSMACLGDSITNQWATSYESNYPYFLKNELGLKECYNYGRAGAPVAVCEKWSTYESISLYYQRIKENVDIISVMGGVNDMGFNIPIGTISDNTYDTFYGALNYMYSGMKRMFPDAWIFFMSNYKTYHGETKNKLGFTREDYANAVVEFCRVNNIPCLDMFHLGAITYENAKNETITTDGVHPTVSFYETSTAPQIAQFIRENYGK